MGSIDDVRINYYTQLGYGYSQAKQLAELDAQKETHDRIEAERAGAVAAQRAEASNKNFVDTLVSQLSALLASNQAVSDEKVAQTLQATQDATQKQVQAVVDATASLSSQQSFFRTIDAAQPDAPKIAGIPKGNNLWIIALGVVGVFFALRRR